MSESEKIGLEVDTNIDSIREKIILKIVKNIFNIDNNTQALLTSNLNKFMKQNLTRENIFDINEDDYTEIQSKYYIIDKDNINTNIIKIFKYLVKLIKNKYNVNSNIQYQKIFGSLINQNKPDYLYNLFNIHLKCLLLDKENLFGENCNDINLINKNIYIGNNIDIKISSLHQEEILEMIKTNSNLKSLNNKEFLQKNKDNIIVIINFDEDDESDDDYDF